MAEAVPRFCILGGGLSGLTSALFLQRRFPLARICVVEAAQRCGGSILSSRGGRGQLLEQGFHSSVLLNKNGREALGLTRLLGLQEEVISANIEASSRRHLLHYGQVQLFPRVHHILRYAPPLVAEPIWPRGSSDDESVHAFIARRTSRGVADRIADPICRGQLAGDARELSVRTCFPRLWFNERRFRSIFIGALFSALSAYRQRSWLSLELSDPLLQRVSTGGRCYSFRSGMGCLISRLEERLQVPSAGTRPAEILRGCAVVKLREIPSAAGTTAEAILSDGRTVAADTIVAAVPPQELAPLLDASGLDVPSIGPCGSTSTSVCQILGGMKQESVAVVNMAFDSDVLRGRFRGAGYFAGSLEQQAQPVLSMSWDSQLFPEQEPVPGKARLTAYLGGQGQAPSRKEEAEAAALAAVRQHLGIQEEPAEVCATVWPQAIPQYAVGHHHLMRALDAARMQRLPWLQVAGCGYYGPRAAADEVVDARKLADALGRRFERFPGLVENEAEEDLAQRYGAGFDID